MVSRCSKFCNFIRYFWKFNIENAPWYGRFFERLVKSVKRNFKKQFGKERIDYDEMISVLKGIVRGAEPCKCDIRLASRIL